MGQYNTIVTEIGLVIGIILSWLSSIWIVLKYNNEKKSLESNIYTKISSLENEMRSDVKAVENKVSINEGRIDSNKTLVIALKEEHKQSIAVLEKSGRDSQEALLNEIKESNKLLAELNAHIIRFEERQITQWKTLELHSRKIEDLEQKVRTK